MDLIAEHNHPIIVYLHSLLETELVIKPLSELPVQEGWEEQEHQNLSGFIVGTTIYVQDDVQDCQDRACIILHEALHYAVGAPKFYPDKWEEFYHELLAFCVEDIFISGKLTEDHIQKNISIVITRYDFSPRVIKCPIDVRYVMDSYDMLFDFPQF